MLDPVGDLTLRPLVPGDAETIACWAADVVFRDHAGWARDLTVDEIADFYRRVIHTPPPDLIRLGAEVDGTLVGYVDLHGTQPRRRELGFLVGGRHRWGAGLGARCGAAGLDHGFQILGLEEIWAEAPAANQRSVRVLERLGLLETGPGDEDVLLGVRTRNRQFAITRRRWCREHRTRPRLDQRRPTDDEDLRPG